MKYSLRCVLFLLALLGITSTATAQTKISQYPAVTTVQPGYLFLLANPSQGNYNIRYDKLWYQLGQDLNITHNALSDDTNWTDAVGSYYSNNTVHAFTAIGLHQEATVDNANGSSHSWDIHSNMKTTGGIASGNSITNNGLVWVSFNTTPSGMYPAGSFGTASGGVNPGLWVQPTPGSWVFVNPAGGSGTAPSITAQPQPVTVTVPAQAQFTVAASGSATLTYQWKVDKGSGPANVSGTEYSGATTATLTINPSATSDAGTYSCVVQNSYGTVTSAGAVLTVNSAPVGPTITSQPQPVTVTAPAQAQFAVTATGTAPLTYQWKVDKGSGAANVSGTEYSGATTATLTINPTATSDAGTYSCVVQNSVNSVSSSGALLTVNASGGLLVNENFEGTGLPTGWGGGGNFDYTTSPLDGAQSWQLDSTGGGTIAPVAGWTSWADSGGEIYVRFKFRPDALPTSFNTIFTMQDAAQTVFPLSLELHSDGSIVVKDQSGFLFSSPTAVMTAGTAYTVWVHYKAGTGANSVCEVWFSTGTTLPTDPTFHAGGSNGSGTVDAAFMKFSSGVDGSSSSVLIIDDVAVSTSPL